MKPLIKTVNCGFPAKYEIDAIIVKHNLSTPFTIRVAYKEGKRRKIKNARIHSYKTTPCELCGYHTYIAYRMGGKEISREIY